MKRYKRPCIMIIEVTEVDELLTMSELGPGEGDAGSPGFGAKSVWDEEDTHYNNNIKEEDYEVHD